MMKNLYHFLHTFYSHYPAIILPISREYLTSPDRGNKKSEPTRCICSLHLVSVSYQPHLMGVQSPSKIIIYAMISSIPALSALYFILVISS